MSYFRLSRVALAIKATETECSQNQSARIRGGRACRDH